MEAGESIFARAVLEGRPLEGELVIDCHVHLGPWHNFHIPDNGPEGLLRSMDLVGIDLAVCSPHRAIAHDYRGGNDEVAAFHRAHPDRVRPYVTINPNYPAEEVADEIGRWRKEGLLLGFKIHPSEMHYAADGEKLVPLWEAAQELGLPVLVHSWASDDYASPATLGKLADRYPAAKVIVAHSATTWEMIEQATTEAQRRDNVLLDLTGSSMLPGALETMVESVGAEKILFGTDVPFIDPRPQVGRVALARISDDDKRLIFGLNAKRVFGV
ncbi:MAG: amidohydrolase family protein [Armatimonadota bacterium]